MQKNIIITLLFSVFIAVFAILNAAAVPVNLIFTKVDISAALVILIAASFGAIIVYSLDTLSKLKIKKKNKENEKTILTLSAENQGLKTQVTELLGEQSELKVSVSIYESEVAELKGHISTLEKNKNE